MVNVNPGWEMPRKGVVKVNVHGHFEGQRLQNGNISGVGVVVRDSRGKIIRMLAGSLGIENQRSNELHAFMEGLKLIFDDDYPKAILETDHVAAYWEWKDSRDAGATPTNAFIIQQLNTRKADRNFNLEICLTDASDNTLVAYLAQHGATNWKQMVVIEKSFGRLFELWSLDMGLGRIGPQFHRIHEEDVNVEAMEAEVENPPLAAEILENQEGFAINGAGLHAGNVFVGMEKGKPVVFLCSLQLKLYALGFCFSILNYSYFVC